MKKQPPKKGVFKAISELLCAVIQPRKFRYISAEQLQSRICSGEETTVVDCRDSESYKECHIPGSVNIPYTEFMTKYNTVDFKNSNIVTVCYAGYYSRAAAQKYGRAGCLKVASLLGGMDAWLKSKMPTTEN
ncbi:MAG: rhodanese-like domain-containing protein [Humidesulfovibrio sp.]|uniref:rhodanese-like domain-containing protein n=1 Tax=Humidesulfovibrio sp. TaxID=2910988 RepID=UPI002734C8AE|nr:rhodanese-like domain-containing protein [Humidesulfovibrio sp.]MDP2846801.1 rhodanese-like domain-containing protein [Humidesulfovibrio sp.]